MSSVTADASGTGVDGVRRRVGLTPVYRWEVVKLAAQAKNRVVLGVCLLAPFLFVAVIRVQSTLPSDTLFGRWTRDSGFATPLVVLAWAGQWALPAITSVVAGDIFSAEDRYGTWKTILTRSGSRAQIFVAKTLAAATYSVAATGLLALASLTAGVLLVGRQPLVGLGGDLLSPGHSAVLALESWACALPPVLAFTALGILVSIASGNSAVGMTVPVVIGLGMEVAGMASFYGLPRDLLLSTHFTAWHGLAVSEPYYGPIGVGLVVSGLYVACCLAVAYLLLRRRDLARSS